MINVLNFVSNRIKFVKDLYSIAYLYSTVNLYSTANHFSFHFFLSPGVSLGFHFFFSFLWAFLAFQSFWWAFGPHVPLGFPLMSFWGLLFIGLSSSWAFGPCFSWAFSHWILGTDLQK